MRTALIVLVIVFFVAILSVALMAGTGEPDPRTFVFVRELYNGQIGMVVGADVTFLRMKDHEPWPFPKTGPGGWTHREVPDGNYLISVKADGYVTKILYKTIPIAGRFPHRTFTILLERKK